MAVQKIHFPHGGPSDVGQQGVGTDHASQLVEQPIFDRLSRITVDMRVLVHVVGHPPAIGMLQTLSRKSVFGRHQ